MPIKHPTKIASLILDSMEEATEMLGWWMGFLLLRMQKSKKFLSRVAAADSLFWPMSQNEQYSCKSSYRFLKEDEDANFREEPPDNENGLWKGIWALDSQNNVKNLIW